jgi:hypothetical protein
MRRQIAAPGPLNAPQAIRVQADARGRPTVVAGDPVELLSNDWLQEDGWWRDEELHRRYYEVTTVSGEHVGLFRDLTTDGWFSQRV